MPMTFLGPDFRTVFLLECFTKNSVGEVTITCLLLCALHRVTRPIRQLLQATRATATGMECSSSQHCQVDPDACEAARGSSIASLHEGSTPPDHCGPRLGRRTYRIQPEPCAGKAS